MAQDGAGAMIAIYALIGAKALYLLFIWLLSAAGGAWMADRKGYGERFGLTCGLLLTVVGFLLVLILPGRPGSAWKVEGWFPKRGASRPDDAPVLAAPSGGPAGSGGRAASGGPAASGGETALGEQSAEHRDDH